MRFYGWFAPLLCLSVGAQSAESSCPPPSMTREQWQQLKEDEFAVPAATDVQSLVLALVPCLGDSNPAIRDGLAYEALMTWMRGKRVTAATAKTMLRRLLQQLSARGDGAEFAQPFAALALAEVARMDRIESFLDSGERAALISRGTDYLASVRDYRGFDERQGWRHGVAHAADLMMQLALNPQLTKGDLDLILKAIAAQISPEGHFYIYGESDRLARPVMFIAQRHLHSNNDWTRWLQNIASSAPFKSWSEIHKSQAGLAKRQNTVAFLNALYVSIDSSDDAESKTRLLAPLKTILIDFEK